MNKAADRTLSHSPFRSYKQILSGPTSRYYQVLQADIIRSYKQILSGPTCRYYQGIHEQKNLIKKQNKMKR